MRMRTVLVLTLPLAALAPLLAGCGGRGRAAGTLGVVAAENVYGDIAAQIGGPRVAVTSLLTSPSADPHLFEPGAAGGLAVAGARVVLENGLGYDTFMERLVRAAPSGRRIVVTMAGVLGVRGRAANPHLWYDVPRLGRIAAAIAAALERADPRHASAYRAGLARFDRSLAPLARAVAAIRRRYRGEPVAETEPVAGYLLAAAGLDNLAPAAFTRAIEQGSEPSPAAVAAMESLVARRRIRALIYNRQTVSPITARLRATARRAGIPVVPVT
ncbi:MAG TPA: zinc ABC transporter substrate-binding protein, partial [Gaiellaceae bacterium]|nr:zinc ABC transporter substrate-binding protein [Gaiellaceae bacterium]